LEQKKTPGRVMVNEFETIPALECLQRNWLRFLPKDLQPRAIFAAGLFLTPWLVVADLNEALEWATEAPDGRVAEWFKAAVLKTAVGASSP
jgi:hypothetical protein